MPWEDKTVKKTRMEFVSSAVDGEKSISELCREYSITRKTGYKWITRYKNGENLSDKSHAAFNTPNKTPDDVEQKILDFRANHPAWGARKIKRLLEDKGNSDIPAASTIADILKRNHCIEPEESKKHIAYKHFEYSKPNELWQMDFKGDFGMLDGNRCHPLTILDDHSRFNLCLEAKDNQQTGGVVASLNRVFDEYGLPKAILCDNGKPWGDSKPGYTLIELWFMQLNILPIHGRPIHPQTQGKEERFHRTMKYELLKYVAIQDMKHAQEVFDTWRYEYNYERPHNSLRLDVPAKHYKASNIILPSKIMEPDYDSTARLRKVNCKGYISIQNHRYFLSETFIEKFLEITDELDDCIALHYGDFQIAKIDLKEQLFVSKKIYRPSNRR